MEIVVALDCSTQAAHRSEDQKKDHMFADSFHPVAVLAGCRDLAVAPMLPKPEGRPSGSASKPDLKLSLHPAPQRPGAYHAYLS